MKQNLFLICCALTACVMLLSACAAPQATEPPLTETSEPENTTEPTEAPVITKAPTETEEATEPAYLPCNLAFQSDRDGNLEIYVMGPDGSNQTNLTNNPADDYDPAWSADGSQIVFASDRETDSGVGQHLFIMNADGSDVRQLNFYEHNSQWPDWSNDGALITYTSDWDIYIIKANGSNPEAVNMTNSPDVEESSSTFSPDGTQLAWLAGPEDNRQIVVMEMDGGATNQITDSGNVYDVAWSVDGRLFIHWENSPNGCFNCIMQSDGSEISDAGGKGSIQEYLPFWNEKGERVEVTYLEGAYGDYEIALVGEVYPEMFNFLTFDPGDDTNPDWPANCGPH
jgi:TolB protein